MSKCIGLMKSVESNAFVILWCLCTILCIKNQHAEVTCQNPLGFLTSGAGPQTSKNDKISASKFLGAAILTKQGPRPFFLSVGDPPADPLRSQKTLRILTCDLRVLVFDTQDGAQTPQNDQGKRFDRLHQPKTLRHVDDANRNRLM